MNCSCSRCLLGRGCKPVLLKNTPRRLSGAEGNALEHWILFKSHHVLQLCMAGAGYTFELLQWWSRRSTGHCWCTSDLKRTSLKWSISFILASFWLTRMLEAGCVLALVFEQQWLCTECAPSHTEGKAREHVTQQDTRDVCAPELSLALVCRLNWSRKHHGRACSVLMLCCLMNAPNKVDKKDQSALTCS